MFGKLALRLGFGKPSASWTPASISGAIGWFDASDTSTIVSNLGSVSQWSNKLGSNNLTQATGSNQALTGVDTINSKNDIKFDGSNDYFDIPSGIISQMTGDYSIYLVQKSNANVNQFFICFGSNQIYFKADFSDTTYQGNAGAGPANAFNYSATTNLTQNLWSLRKSGTTATAKRNAQSNTFTAANVSPASGRVGAQTGGAITDSPVNGDIAEILIYTRALTTQENQTIEDYLKAKWGTP